MAQTNSYGTGLARGLLTIVLVISGCTESTELMLGDGDPGEVEAGDGDPGEVEAGDGGYEPLDADVVEEPDSALDEAGDGEPSCLEVELCGDGEDNDCDGVVGEGCGDCLCTPGEVRYCDNPIYCGLGTQRCLEDGLSWGRCDEALVPLSCPRAYLFLPEDEACLIEAGACVQDFWDLDRDGDSWDSLGLCSEPACPGEG